MSHQKQSKRDGKKRSKGSRPAAVQEDHKKLLLIAIAIVYVVAFAIGSVPFFLKHYTSKHVHLSDRRQQQQQQTIHVQANGNAENTLTVSFEEPNGRVMQGTAPKATVESLQEQIPPRRKPEQGPVSKKMLIEVAMGKFDGIPFYRCTNNKPQTFNIGDRDLVILDGGAFFDPGHYDAYRSKEGMQKLTTQDQAVTAQNEGTFLELCNAGFKDGLTSVIAVDTTLVSPPQLLRLLQQGLRVSLPVTALVTPRDSSATMVEWLLYQQQYDPASENAPEQQMLARHWIPVSPQWDQDKSHGLLLDSNSSHDNDVEDDDKKKNNKYPAVFSLYGESSNANSAEQIILRQTMGATSRAIPGGDDCYLENYREFAWAIFEYLIRQDELPGKAAIEAVEQLQQQLPDHIQVEASVDKFLASK